VIFFFSSYHITDASNNWISFDYGIDLSQSAEINSTIIAEGDIQLFPLSYLKKVEGFREDLNIIDRTGSLGENIYDYDSLKFKTPASLRNHRIQREKIFLNKVTKLYYTQNQSRDTFEKYSTVPSGFIYGVVSNECYKNIESSLPFSSRILVTDFSKVFLDYFSENILSKVFMSAGENLSSLGYSEYSMEYFKNAGENAEIAKEAHNNLAILYEKMGNFQEALNEYEKALKTDNDNDILHYNLANLYMKMNKKEDAKKYYLKAHELNPKHDIYLYAIGSFETQEGRFKDAHKYLSQLLRLNPDHFEGNLLQGDISKRLGLFPDSEKYYKKAIALKPDDPRSYNNIAGLFKNLNKTKNAIKYYEKAFKVGKEYPLPLFNLGVIYYNDLKDYEKAKYYWEKFLDETDAEEFKSQREKVKQILESMK